MTSPDSAGPHSAPAQPHVVHVAHPQSRFAGLGTIAMLIVTVALIGVVFLFLWQMSKVSPTEPVQSGAAEQGDLSALRDRLASDEARTATLERGGPGGTGALKASLDRMQSDLAAFSARLGKLETAPDPQATARLDDLDKRLASMRADFDLRVAALERNALGSDMPQRMAAMTSAQAALEARIARLEGIDPAVTMRRAAAELALANLVRASDGSGSFAVELQTFRALMPNAPEAGELAPIAMTGAPSRADLVARFPSVAAAALAAENRSRATGWLGKLWSNIGNLIIVRRIGDKAGDDSESILARAGSRLNQGDLEGAIAQVKTMKGAARAGARDWLREAEARSAIERDTLALANRMTQLLATP